MSLKTPSDSAIQTSFILFILVLSELFITVQLNAVHINVKIINITCLLINNILNGLLTTAKNKQFNEKDG